MRHGQDVEGGWKEWRNGASSSDPPPQPPPPGNSDLFWAPSVSQASLVAQLVKETLSNLATKQQYSVV